MRILFINRHTGSRTLPLASASLASALEQRFGDGVECRILEFPPEFDVAETAGEILAKEPDILALTLYTWSRAALLDLAAMCIKQSEAAGTLTPVVIAGGPEVTADPQGVGSHPAVHLVISGEGESALSAVVENLQNKPREEWQELVSRYTTPFIHTPVDNLDSFPSPWKARDLAGRVWDDNVWELTRGCPFSCHFCFESKGEGRVRHKSIEQAAAELRELRERGTHRIFLLDPTFNAPPKRAVELLHLFINEAPDLEWHIEVRSEFLDEEQAELFSMLNCTLQIGLQTADPGVAAGIGRPFSPDDFARKLLLLHEQGVPYGLDLIFGLPGDSLDGFRESLNFALSCAPNHVDLFPLAVLPGTRLRDRAAGLDLNYRAAPPYTVTGGGGFTTGDLTAAAALSNATHALYNTGRAVPWFLAVCEALDQTPVELIAAAAADTGFSEMLQNESFPEDQRPRRMAALVGRLSESSGRPDIARVLEDVVALFMMESAITEGHDHPDRMEFNYDAPELQRHLEMGITNTEELAAFVPLSPGYYEIDRKADGLFWKRMAP